MSNVAIGRVPRYDSAWKDVPTMGRSRIFGAGIALLAAISLVLQGCASRPLRMEVPLYTVICTVAPNTPTPTPGLAMPTNTPPVSSTAPAAISSATPETESKYIVQEYTATDGESIYYFSNSGINRMDMDGGHDRKTPIKGCYEFLTINQDGLYYIAYDDAYKPTEVENSWQVCNSFNLMFYNTTTNKVTTLMKHVSNATTFQNSIYAVDHLKHSHIRRYDLSSKDFSDIAGFPTGADASDVVAVWAYKGMLYMDCGTGEAYKLFAITGDTISTSEVQQPDFSEDTAPEDYQMDENGDFYIWTGSSYKQLELTNVYDAISYNSKLYVLTSISTDDDLTAMLYSASMDGTATKLAGPVITVDEAPVEQQIVAGWYFAFFVEEDEGTAYKLLMKVKLP